MHAGECSGQLCECLSPSRICVTRLSLPFLSPPAPAPAPSFFLSLPLPLSIFVCLTSSLSLSLDARAPAFDMCVTHNCCLRGFWFVCIHPQTPMRFGSSYFEDVGVAGDAARRAVSSGHVGADARLLLL